MVIDGGPSDLPRYYLMGHVYISQVVTEVYACADTEGMTTWSGGQLRTLFSFIFHMKYSYFYYHRQFVKTTFM